nr:unnamed protein product [Digitaria exilis]
MAHTTCTSRPSPDRTPSARPSAPPAHPTDCDSPIPDLTHRRPSRVGNRRCRIDVHPDWMLKQGRPPLPNCCPCSRGLLLQRFTNNFIHLPDNSSPCARPSPSLCAAGEERHGGVGEEACDGAGEQQLRNLGQHLLDTLASAAGRMDQSAAAAALLDVLPSIRSFHTEVHFGDSFYATPCPSARIYAANTPGDSVTPPLLSRS